MTSATEVAGRLFLAVYWSSSKRSPDPPRRAAFRTRNRSACKFSAGDGRGAGRTCRILLRLASNHGQGFKPGYFWLADQPGNCFSFSMNGGTHCPGRSFLRPNPKWPRKLEFRNSFRARRCHSVFGLCGPSKPASGCGGGHGSQFTHRRNSAADVESRLVACLDRRKPHRTLKRLQVLYDVALLLWCQA